jgi:hypothetical protein
MHSVKICNNHDNVVIYKQSCVFQFKKKYISRSFGGKNRIFSYLSTHLGQIVELERGNKQYFDLGLTYISLMILLSLYFQAIVQIPDKVRSFSLTPDSDDWSLLVGSNSGHLYRTTHSDFKAQYDQAQVQWVFLMDLCKTTFDMNLIWEIKIFMPGAYSVTLPHSVIPSFHKLVSVHYLLNGCTHLIQIWYIWINRRIMQVKFEFGHGQMIFWMSYSFWKKFQFLLTFVWMDV